MPAVSQRQQRFFGMVDAGKLPRPKGLNDAQVKEFAETPRNGLPYRSAAAKAKRRQKIAAIRAR